MSVLSLDSRGLMRFDLLSSASARSDEKFLP
jgi:hypothetical protein